VINLRALVLLLSVLAGWRAEAQVSVISSRPDSATLTVYRQGIAQITEIRQVELPAGPVYLVFERVVDTLLPQSALLNGAGRPVAESNFDFDALSPASLLEHSVGKSVTLVRTNRRSGAVTRQAATIVSASAADGVVFRTAEGNEAFKCSGLPERLEFNEIPADLRTTPTLSVRLAGGEPGKRTLTLSYLVHGITWSADYVARLNAKSNRMDLSGWVTLTNDTNVSFDRAQVQLVSGELALVWHGEGGSSPQGYDTRRAGDIDHEGEVEELEEPEPVLPLQKCAPMQPANSKSAASERSDYDEDEELAEVQVTGTRILRESLGDYKLYRLPEPTDLKSYQTKQALFLKKPRVRVERFYQVTSVDFNSYDDSESIRVPRVGLQWRNEASRGLGEPLPGGKVRVFERFGSGEVFAGAGKMSDKPVGLPVEIFYADADGLRDERSREPEPQYPEESESRLAVSVQHHLSNNKSVPVTVVIQHESIGYLGKSRVLSSNRPVEKGDGDARWRIRMPAGSRRILSYELEADNRNYRN
jgi:hypothetical protein